MKKICRNCVFWTKCKLSDKSPLLEEEHQYCHSGDFTSYVQIYNAGGKQNLDFEITTFEEFGCVFFEEKNHDEEVN